MKASSRYLKWWDSDEQGCLPRIVTPSAQKGCTCNYWKRPMLEIMGMETGIVDEDPLMEEA